jgi:CheY-like chemotaxis protein/Tfp pilus assembly protein PilZ
MPDSSPTGAVQDGTASAPPIEKLIRRESQDAPQFAITYHDVEDWLAEYRGVLTAGQIFVPTQDAFAPGDSVTLVVSFPGLRVLLHLQGRVESVANAQRRPKPDAQSGILVALADASRTELADAVGRIEAHDPAWMSRVVRVLVVEDNLHAAQLIEDGLHLAARRSLGGRIAFHVPRMATVADALAFLRKKSIDALVTDVYLGADHGAVLIEYVRAQPSLQGIPVIAISAGHDTITREAVMTAGADQFLQKPLRFQEIARVISDALGLERQ